MKQDSNRIILDVSSLMRWSGPPVGIVRVERQFTSWALANLPNVVLAYFDAKRMAYCELRSLIQEFVNGDIALDAVSFPDPGRRRKTDLVPGPLQPLVLWIGRPRYMLLARLEAVRLHAKAHWRRRLAERVQRLLMSKKYRVLLLRADGTRRLFLFYDMLRTPTIEFTADDTLVCAGSGWVHTNIHVIARLKSLTHFRFVLLCHDLIPLLFPQLYKKHDVEMFRSYMAEAFSTADLIVTTSRKNEADCRVYCTENGFVANKITVSPLGFDANCSDGQISSLPNCLVPNRFVLMVGTIEPRKGHRLLYRVWRRLVLDGVASAHGFKLVFAGRTAGMTDDLLAQIRADRAVTGQIQILHEVDDDLLGVLYKAAAFCVFPSKYEGYGLPVCEAFSHGKAMLTSTGGALPELAEGLSPCLDPDDEEAWYCAIREWIERPDAKVAYEQAIKSRFRHPSWSEAATRFFALCKSQSAPAHGSEAAAPN